MRRTMTIGLALTQLPWTAEQLPCRFALRLHSGMAYLSLLAFERRVLKGVFAFCNCVAGLQRDARGSVLLERLQERDKICLLLG